MATKNATLRELARSVEISAVRREPTARELREYDEEDKNRSPYGVKYANDRRYFTVTLTYRGRRMRVDYHQGSAWKTDPTAAEVLDCIVSDSVSYDNARNFEDWASDYGYDIDSRRAERLYRDVQRQRDDLVGLLGSEYRAFCEAERD